MKPSPQQLELFSARDKSRPVVLFYELDGAGTAALADAARAHGGRQLWSAREDHVLVGGLERFERASQFHFHTRGDARAFVESPAHAAALRDAHAVRVSVLAAQPMAVALLSGVLARVLPWVPFDNSEDATEEPGIGRLRIMPTVAAAEALKSHAEQDSPIVMINWLKFRDRAAYLRYGKVAMAATHSIGAKLLYAARYQQVIIGNGGDPAAGLWDEFALMQYPGRRAFFRMTALKRYRKGLADREAGLTETGQGLVVSVPDAAHVWRG
jgi:uncharacterized protein (DUF1330 family)